LHFSMDEHFQRLADWIDLESVAEAERLSERRKRQNGPDAEKSGETLLDLVVTDEDAGLGGRYLITLVKRNRTLQLPWNRLRVGSPVVLTPNDDSSGDACQGVVTAISRKSIQVAVNDWPDAERLRIDLSPDEITRKRMLNALKRAKDARGRTKELRDILLGERDLSFKDEEECSFTAELNESQQAAIRFALSASDVAIIHGPPGTGKTTTIVELICQAIAKGQKVLACAPSNTAVDNLLEKLVDARQKTVRLGHPARVSTRLQDYTLDGQVARHELTGLIHEMRRESEGLFRQAVKFTRGKPVFGAKREMRKEAKRLKADIRMLEQQAIDSIVDNADVVCATTTLDESLLGDRRFDLVVIDEACQSTEPGSWMPVLRADRLVLAGDHCQLPPTVLSKQAAKEGLEVSLLERLVGLYGDRITRRLNVQYRMHDQIMNFSSAQFYDGALQSHDSVSGHLLSDLDHVDEQFVTLEPVTFIDSAGAGWDEELEPDGLSKRNLQEAELVLRKVAELQDAGLRGRDIGVIAPYAAQVRWLRQNSPDERVEIDTVDGFQGREKEAVIISMVRSNADGEIGFLSDARRMNVALTRARRKLIVIGDSATVGGNEFFAAMLEYFESIGAYHTVWEEGGA
jgi:ATP-dependent RNA/DNA helicase IGHMBP2